MKREIGVLMLLSAVLLSGCGSGDQESANRGARSTSSHSVTMKPEQETNQISTESGQENKTWTSENNEVKISPVKVNKNGTPVVVSVEVNGMKKEFNWKFPEDPRVFYSDVTGDSKQEAIIITNLGRGTGTSVDELHVLNSEDLSEINVPGYEEIVAEYIETNVITNDDGNLVIKVKAKGEDYEFSYDVDPGVKVQDKLQFGGTVTYTLKNQKITLNIGGSIGTSPIYVSGFHITFKFDSVKNELIVDQIKVEPYSSIK